MNGPKQFLYVIRPTRPAMLVDGLDARENAIVGEHFEWLQRQQARGVVRMAGRTDEGERTFGIVLLEVPTQEDARSLMLEDPAVAQGVMHAELHPFSVALWSPAAAAA
jgi:uncharacterized protein YciI